MDLFVSVPQFFTVPIFLFVVFIEDGIVDAFAVTWVVLGSFSK